MQKRQIIARLNKTDDFCSMGFEAYADDGKNALLIKKRGKRYLMLNRYQPESGKGGIYSGDITEWQDFVRKTKRFARNKR